MKIVNLLNTVFPGWGDQEFFNWKYNNPFGDSIILYRDSSDKEHLLAVRMFMAWRMKDDQDNRYLCYQATDSATHPLARGQGLFSKLTLEALDKTDNNSFVFNFPNHNSVNIYLKLGWRLEETKRALYVPLINNITDSKNSIKESSILQTEWDDLLLEWRVRNLRFDKFQTDDKKIVMYRTIHKKGVKIADIIHTHDTLNSVDVRLLFKHLRKCGFYMVRYIGFNTVFEEIMINNVKLRFRYGDSVNLVSFNKPEDKHLRLEMIDADYIK